MRITAAASGQVFLGIDRRRPGRHPRDQPGIPTATSFSGGSAPGPNYDAASVADALDRLSASGLNVAGS